MVLCKFHSVFLSQKGQVYTCGHGPGGRLGHGDEQTCLVIEMSLHSLGNFSKILINRKLQLTKKVFNQHKENIKCQLIIDF